MKEFLESNDGIKMMAMVICGIEYKDEKYLVYSILRNNSEANIFVSKLVSTSTGYTSSSTFMNGEKEVLEGIIKKLISKVPVTVIEKEGFNILSNIELTDSLSFDKDICYVSTVSKEQLKDILIFYKLVNEELLESPTIEIQNDKKVLNKGSIISIIFILIGLFALIMSIYILVS